MKPAAMVQSWLSGDEDLAESFTRVDGLCHLFDAEALDEDDEYYDGDGSHQPDPLEISVSQRVDPTETTQTDTVSGHTQAVHSTW